MKIPLSFFLLMIIFSAEARDSQLLNNLLHFHEQTLEFALLHDATGILRTNQSLLQSIDIREVEEREQRPQERVEDLGLFKKLSWSTVLYNKSNPETSFQIINGFMRKSEKGLAKLYPNLTETVYKLAIVAKDKSEELFPEVEPDLGVRDAYRHTLWSALMTKHLGPDVAALYLTAHEVEDGNKLFDINYSGNDGKMDFLNNELGRIVSLSLDIQTNKELFVLVKKIVETGRAAMLNNSNPKISSLVREIVRTDFKQRSGQGPQTLRVKQ